MGSRLGAIFIELLGWFLTEQNVVALVGFEYGSKDKQGAVILRDTKFFVLTAIGRNLSYTYNSIPYFFLLLYSRRCQPTHQVYRREAGTGHPEAGISQGVKSFRVCRYSRPPARRAMLIFVTKRGLISQRILEMSTLIGLQCIDWYPYRYGMVWPEFRVCWN